MGARDQYEANKAAHAARQQEQKKSPKKEPWFFKQPAAIDRFTGWLQLYTFLLVIATIISAAILYKTDLTLHDTLVSAQRPWLSIKPSVVGPIDLNDRRLSVRATIMVKNTGRSPAGSVYIYADSGPRHEISKSTERQNSRPVS